jgi:hypothetical protein
MPPHGSLIVVMFIATGNQFAACTLIVRPDPLS